MMTLKEKEEKLYGQIKGYTKENLCIAFSGGVDSSLLLQIACAYAREQGTVVYALTMDTVLHPSVDREIAGRVAKQAGAVHVILTLDELAVPEMEKNPRNRCYLCKKALYEKMLDFAREKGITCLLEGTNEDDLHVYRPGLQAVKELGVNSPLADCGLTKKEVRILAEKWGISVANRPSAPCLATRLPYGDRLDLSLLRRIEEGEEFVKGLGFGNVRLRVHGSVVRLEIDSGDFGKILEHKEPVIRKLKELGFPYITLDLEGFRSGSMDLNV